MVSICEIGEMRRFNCFGMAWPQSAILGGYRSVGARQTCRGTPAARGNGWLNGSTITIDVHLTGRAASTNQLRPRTQLYPARCVYFRFGFRLFDWHTIKNV